MEYTAKIYFTFLDLSEDEPNKDSETRTIIANNPEEAIGKAFKEVIGNWEEGSIAITQIDVM